MRWRGSRPKGRQVLAVRDRGCGLLSSLGTSSRISDDTAMAMPERVHHVGPYLDVDSAAVLDEALEELGRRRFPNHWLGDDAVTVHLLASLQRQIGQRLPDAVADARDQQCSWAEIGDLIGTTRAAAWNRYGRPDRRGHTRPVED